jgi:hypothetical protein
MKYIYSPQHQGLVEAPLMTEPKEEDYYYKSSFLNIQGVTHFRKGDYDKDTAAYNTWLSSPPAFKVRPEDIKDFLEPIDESQFEVQYQVLKIGGWRDTTKFVYDQYMNTDCKRIVAIPKKGNESKEQSPSVERGYSEAFWKELRERFFKECTQKFGGGIKVVMTPHNIFEWFKPSLIHQPYPPLQSRTGAMSDFLNSDNEDDYGLYQEDIANDIKRLYGLLEDCPLKEHLSKWFSYTGNDLTSADNQINQTNK